MSLTPVPPSAECCSEQCDVPAFDKPVFEHAEESVHEDKLGNIIEDFRTIPHLDRKVVLKLDLLLMPTMCIIFIFLFLDRANIGNARVAGMQKSLHLTDLQYQTALTITYVPYVLIEIPSNLVLKKLGPRYMLPGLCFSWGLVSLFQAFMHNYAGLLACRFFLGLCEGGLFPGFVLYLSDFYRRHELQTRIGLIYGAASVSGAFSGLLAAAINSLDGKADLRGWQWIFLIEGLVTVIFAIFAMFILPNSPRHVLSFSAEEAEYCAKRLTTDSKSQEDSKITRKAVISAFKELHILNMAVIAFCNGVVIGGLAYFTPSVVHALGYGTVKTQLMSVPPFAIAFVLTLAAAQFADRFQRRGLAAITTLSLAIVGCAINLTCTSIPARYAAICLNVASIYSTAPSILTWIPNNSAPYGKRATAVAIGFVTSNSAGIISTWIYSTSTAPRYLFAVKFNLSLICIEMTLLVVQILLLVRLNRRKTSRREQLLAGVSHLSLHEQMERLGDRHPDFKYTL